MGKIWRKTAPPPRLSFTTQTLAAHRWLSYAAVVVPALFLSACSGLPGELAQQSEEEQNLIETCEALDEAYVESTDFYSALAERPDLSREERETLRAEAIELAGTISNQSFFLLGAATVAEGDDSEIAQSADELVDLAWRVDDATESGSADESLFLSYTFAMREALGDCKELGADIQTSVF